MPPVKLNPAVVLLCRVMRMPVPGFWFPFRFTQATNVTVFVLRFNAGMLTQLSAKLG